VNRELPLVPVHFASISTPWTKDHAEQHGRRAGKDRHRQQYEEIVELGAEPHDDQDDTRRDRHLTARRRGSAQQRDVGRIGDVC